VTVDIDKLERAAREEAMRGFRIDPEDVLSLIARLRATEADLTAAAGELRVSLDDMPPGSLARRLVSANALMRGELAQLRRLYAEARDYDVRVADAELQKLKARSAELENALLEVRRMALDSSRSLGPAWAASFAHVADEALRDKSNTTTLDKRGLVLERRCMHCSGVDRFLPADETDQCGTCGGRGTAHPISRWVCDRQHASPRCAAAGCFLDSRTDPG